MMEKYIPYLFFSCVCANGILFMFAAMLSSMLSEEEESREGDLNE